MNQEMKRKLKRVLPKWVLYLYWAMKVVNVRVIKFIPTYNEDELITGHKSDFLRDTHFMACYNAAVKDGLSVSDKIHWRAHVACWAAKRGAGIEGDFVECGVNKGFLSKIVMDFVGFSGLKKKFYLMDTYEGFSENYLSDKEKDKGLRKGGYEPCYELVKKHFGGLENVEIIKGVIPETLAEAKTDKVAYLHIDMNCVIPEIAAAEYFWDKMVPGAVMLLDDYGHAGHEEQKKGFDEFALRKNVPILCLPTGQGMIIKP